MFCVVIWVKVGVVMLSEIYFGDRRIIVICFYLWVGIYKVEFIGLKLLENRKECGVLEEWVIFIKI